MRETEVTRQEGRSEADEVFLVFWQREAFTNAKRRYKGQMRPKFEEKTTEKRKRRQRRPRKDW